MPDIEIDKFKNNSMKNTISKLIDKYKPQDTNSLRQNEIINVLEQERDLEKNEKTKADIDYLIEVIKNFFAKKFDAEIARNTTRKKLSEERVQLKAQEIINKNKHLQQSMQDLAEGSLGKQFTQEIISNFKLTPESREHAKQQEGWVRSL